MDNFAIYFSYKLRATYILSDFSNQRVEGVVNSHSRFGRGLNKRDPVVTEENKEYLFESPTGVYTVSFHHFSRKPSAKFL